MTCACSYVILPVVRIDFSGLTCYTLCRTAGVCLSRIGALELDDLVLEIGLQFSISLWARLGC